MKWVMEIIGAWDSSIAVLTRLLNQPWSPKSKKITAKVAMMMVGVTAIRLNSATRRVCSRAPAAPRLLAIRSTTSRRAISAPRLSSSTMSRLSSSRTSVVSASVGARPVITAKVAMPALTAAISRPMTSLPSSLTLEDQRLNRSRLPPPAAEAEASDAVTSGVASSAPEASLAKLTQAVRSQCQMGCRLATCCRKATGHLTPRVTWMSSSRILLRRVLRLRPSRLAALSWLPRVAPRQSSISGRSTSRRTRP